MLELGSLQSTLNALDFFSEASQAAVCSALGARCSEVSTWWAWMALDSTGYEAFISLNTLHHTTDTLPDLDFFLMFPPAELNPY